jgi:hypothetical protein
MPIIFRDIGQSFKQYGKIIVKAENKKKSAPGHDQKTIPDDLSWRQIKKQKPPPDKKKRKPRQGKAPDSGA